MTDASSGSNSGTTPGASPAQYTAEGRRLEEATRREKHWRRWGPYVAERAWGTVREDYSHSGDAWRALTFERSHAQAFRWSEDGLAGLCDNHQRICLAVSLWNERDPLLKEKLFGLSNPEGNHGEDVKECYYYLDATPTHSYLKFLYKYPQSEFPYAQLREMGRRPRTEPERELAETGIFTGNRYFDVEVEYAKASPEDILCRITVTNRGPEAAPLHLLPTIWFRNTWSWGLEAERPSLSQVSPECIQLDEPALGRLHLHVERPERLLFTGNETNTELLFNYPSLSRYYKDAFQRYLMRGEDSAINPADTGTKAAAWYYFMLAPGESRTIRYRLRQPAPDLWTRNFDEIFAERKAEADEFYESFIAPGLSEDARAVQRQAFAGLIWTRQYYHYAVDQWTKGDPAFPPPPSNRGEGRNHAWNHVFNEDIISMPDKWEYPWYAAWDTAFHTIPFSLIDPDFAKGQLSLLLREWYMHPNGQIPAYEWNFSDVNPPVHAWACWRVFQIDRRIRGQGDVPFLESVFHKLLMNFTWWVNRKDSAGNNIFEGGFLGLDNIGVFDRSRPLPGGVLLEQSDGTAWMAMYCLNMLRIAIELAFFNPVYEDIASKFFEHFLYIAHAMNRSGDEGLWDEEDGFYYDRLQFPDGRSMPLKIRSMVGLIPLFAVESLELDTYDRLPNFARRTDWFIKNRPDLCGNLASLTRPGQNSRRLLSLVGRERLRRLMSRMLDETEFLSAHGLRSLSREHAEQPYMLRVHDEEYRISYEPGESSSWLFGGNSNWRGPVWFPLNYLLIESLQKFGYYHGDAIQVECPSGSGNFMPLDAVAAELSRRLSRLFVKDEDGRRPIYTDSPLFQNDPLFRDHILFYEYFHGDSGAGLGASHQTGWTALVAKLLQQTAP
ncbi:MAG: glucosidase [Acidobacteria bacterium]|nr:glucosidase [Acidobacteriota bacterium]